jgi:hypothetical protein
MSNTDEKFVHKYVSIEPLNKKFLKVTLKEDDKHWEEFLDESLEYSKEHRCWVLIHSEIKDFIELINNVEEESGSSESDSTDDELIKKTLTRRLTSESKQLVIDKDAVEDSQDEDVLSVTRRIRGLYRRIRELEKRCEALEKCK